MCTLKTSTAAFLKVLYPSPRRSNPLIRPRLLDPKWTREETDYLFELVRQYDGRFYVVHDRYEFPNSEGTSRSLEVSYANVMY